MNVCSYYSLVSKGQEKKVSEIDEIDSSFTGSPAVRGEKVEDSDVDDGVSDINEPSGNQSQKEKPSERMLGWHMNQGQSGELGPPSYDREATLGHIPRIASGRTVFALSYLLDFLDSVSCMNDNSNKVFLYYLLGFWRFVCCIT